MIAYISYPASMRAAKRRCNRVESLTRNVFDKRPGYATMKKHERLETVSCKYQAE